MWATRTCRAIRDSSLHSCRELQERNVSGRSSDGLKRRPHDEQKITALETLGCSSHSSEPHRALANRLGSQRVALTSGAHLIAFAG